MSYRRKELWKRKSSEKTGLDEEAQLIDNPHKMGTSKREEEKDNAVSFSSVYLLPSLPPLSVFILELWKAWWV
jgi:hypothetical protein